MTNGRAVERVDPKKSRRIQAQSDDRDPFRELHQGQRPYAPHERAGHMTAPDRSVKTEPNPFAGGGRSLIASPLSMALLPPRVTVLSAVGIFRRNIWFEAQALQCPQRADVQ